MIERKVIRIAPGGPGGALPGHMALLTELRKAFGASRGYTHGAPKGAWRLMPVNGL
jgi:hypothetical protein